MPRRDLYDYWLYQAKADAATSNRRRPTTSTPVAVLPPSPPGPDRCPDDCEWCYGRKRGFGDWTGDWTVGA